MHMDDIHPKRGPFCHTCTADLRDEHSIAMNCKGEEVECPVLADAPKDPAPVDDQIHLPAHYARFVIEPIRFIVENELPFMEGNVVKYTLRAKYKNGKQDLQKAKRYLDMIEKREAGDPDWWR